MNRTVVVGLGVPAHGDSGLGLPILDAIEGEAAPGTAVRLPGVDHAAAPAARQLEAWGFACQPKVAPAAGASL